MDAYAQLLTLQVLSHFTVTADSFYASIIAEEHEENFSPTAQYEAFRRRFWRLERHLLFQIA